jgi:predicted secreted Zn-dependent protease
VNIQTGNSAEALQIKWRMSSLCGNDGCVEVAISDNKALVRSSTDATAGYLAFDAAEWKAFLAGVRNHEFDID